MPNDAEKNSTKPPTKAELEKHIKFIGLNPQGNYLLVMNVQQISMLDAKDVLDMLEQTKLTNACGAVMVFGDVNTAVKLLDVSKLQEAIKAEQTKPNKELKKDGKKATTKTA